MPGDRRRRPKIFCFEIPSKLTDGTREAQAIDERGEVLAFSAAMGEDTLQSELVDALADKGFGHKTHEIVWCERDHPRVKAVQARAENREREAGEPEPVETPASALAALHARQAEEHLCQFCAHAPVCVLARAAAELAPMRPVIAACGGFDPPAPRTPHELAEDLDDVARGPTG